MAKFKLLLSSFRVRVAVVALFGLLALVVVLPMRVAEATLFFSDCAVCLVVMIYSGGGVGLCVLANVRKPRRRRRALRGRG